MRTPTLFAILFFPLLVGCPPKDDGSEPLPACTDRQPLTDPLFVGGLVLPAGSCWMVDQSLYLDDGTVTVEEGVSIWFATDVGATIAAGGRLALAGTEADPISLSSEDPLVTWRGVELSDSQGTDNLWTHVEIVNAGSENWSGSAYSGAAVYLSGETTLTMESVAIRNSQSHGLVAFGDVDMTFVDGTFEGNVTPAFVHVGVVGAIGPETTFAGNADSWVSVAFANTDVITEPTTWHALEVPYRVQTRFYVESAWTIEPGTVIEVAQDVAIYVEEEGSLRGEGTGAEPIVFRGVDPVDTGFWTGIEVLSNSPDNQLSGIELLHAGSDAWYGGDDAHSAIYLAEGASLAMTDSLIGSGNGYGIILNYDALLTCSGVDVSDTDGVYAWESGASTPGC